MKLDFLKSRSFIQEDMDNFALQGEALETTISSLSAINKYLGNSNIILQVVKPMILASAELLRIVDLGCGGADILLEIAKYAASVGKKVDLIGVDGNPNIVDLAKRNSHAFPNLNFITADILHPDFELADCDILMSTHFMYHFTDRELIDFLQKQRTKIHRYIIFSELQRSLVSYCGFQVIGFLFRFSKLIIADGLKAIKRSFRRQELIDIFEQAGVGKHSIQWKWAFRYLVKVDMTEP